MPSTQQMFLIEGSCVPVKCWSVFFTCSRALQFTAVNHTCVPGHMPGKLMGDVKYKEPEGGYMHCCRPITVDGCVSLMCCGPGFYTLLPVAKPCPCRRLTWLLECMQIHCLIRPTAVVWSVHLFASPQLFVNYFLSLKT